MSAGTPGDVIDLESDDGVVLCAAAVGDGPTLLVLHGGLGMDHTYFRPDFDRLAAFGRVVLLDQRGNGRSGRTEEPLTMARLAADAAGVIERCGAPATVIGHSFGGFVAQELAVTRPDLVSRLVLLDTTPGQLGERDDPDADQGPPPPDEVVAAFSSAPATDDEYRELSLSLVPFYARRAADELRDRIAAVRIDVRARDEGFAALATWSSVDRLGDLAMPVLLVVGDADHFTSPQQSERIGRQVPDADVRVVADAGHFPWLDQPQVFWPIVEGWLDG